MRELKLTKGLVALLDDEDFEEACRYMWYADAGPWTTYAKTDQIAGRPRLHTFIMQPLKPLVVDHIDKNGLNNTRENLRIVSQGVNSAMMVRRNGIRAKYRGVYEHGKGYIAQITVAYKKHYLGFFPTAEEAALAFNEASLRLRGEGFPLNAP